MIDLLLIPVCAILGRVQGGWKLFGDGKYLKASNVLRKIDGFLLGFIFAYLLSPDHWMYYPLIALFVKLAEQPAVGVKGHVGDNAYFVSDDWYAIDGHLWLSATLRGLIGGVIASLPILSGFLIGFDYNVLWLLPLYTLAFPLALWIGRHMPDVYLGPQQQSGKPWLKLASPWNWSEPLQPLIICILLTGISYA